MDNTNDMTSVMVGDQTASFRFQAFVVWFSATLNGYGSLCLTWQYFQAIFDL